MATTEINLDLQTDKVLTSPRVQDEIQLQDATAVRKLSVDWVEPVGADRTITFRDPGQDAEVSYVHEVQANQDAWKEILLTSDQLDDVNDGIQAAVAFSLSGLPLDTETIIIKNNTDGSETFTWRAAASAPFDVQIGGDVSASLANLASAITSDSSFWAADVRSELTAIDTEVVVVRKLIPDDGDADRIFGSTTNGQVVDYGATPSDFDYTDTALVALPSSEPPRRNFGIGRGTASLVPGEQHTVLAEEALFTWNANLGTWKQIGIDVPDATSAPGGGTIGKSTADEDFGLEIVGGAMRTKVDGVTLGYDVSGNMKSLGGGGGGAVTADVSVSPAFTRDISGTTPTTPGTTGTDTDTLDFPNNFVTGQRFEFTVPDDYAGGDVVVYATYRMSAPAVPITNLTVRVEGQAEILDVDSGTITTLPVNYVDLTTPTDSAIVRDVLFSIPDANVTIGDNVEIFVTRNGPDVSDNRVGDWKVISFDVGFLAGIANTNITHQVEVLSSTDEPSPTPGTIGTDTDVEVYSPSADNELKFKFSVPDNWDQVTAPQIRCSYAMATSAVGVVRLATEGEILNTSAGTVDTIPAVSFDFTPPATADEVARTLIIRQLSVLTLHRGDAVTLKLARRVAVGGNHTGGFKLIGVTVSFGVGVVELGSGGGSGTGETYLEQGIFGNQSPTGIYGDTAYPDFSGDFDALDRMYAEVNSARIDVSYRGRLATTQTQISDIKLNVKGVGTSPQYVMKVYVEGTGLVYTSGVPIAAPGTLTQITLPGGALTAQPTGQKRYHVVMEAYLDNTEELLVSRPFVTQA